MTQPLESPQGQPNNGGTESAPPYADYLNKVPEAMRGVVEPAFKEWDANVTRMRQSELDRLNQYQPYERFVKEYEPEALEMAVNLATILEQQPELVFQNLAQTLGYQIGEDEDDTPPTDNGAGGAFDLSSAPEFNELREQLGGIAQFLQDRDNQTQQQNEIAQVKEELRAAQEKYGDFDVEYVLTKASITGNLDAAIQEYQQKLGIKAKELVTPSQTAPIVGGSNGSMPSNTEDRGKWTTDQKNEAALAILRAANKET